MTWHVPTYFPNAAIAWDHDLVTADGIRRVHAFSGEAFWLVGALGADGRFTNADVYLWAGDALRYFGFFYGAETPGAFHWVWNANPLAVALPETVDGSWSSGEFDAYFTRAVVDAASGRVLEPPQLVTTRERVDVEPSDVGVAPAFRLAYRTVDAAGRVYEETMWFDDRIDRDDGDPAPGLRRQNVIVDGVVTFDRTYVRWGLR